MFACCSGALSSGGCPLPAFRDWRLMSRSGHRLCGSVVVASRAPAVRGHPPLLSGRLSKYRVRDAHAAEVPHAAFGSARSAGTNAAGGSFQSGSGS